MLGRVCNSGVLLAKTGMDGYRDLAFGWEGVDNVTQDHARLGVR